MLLVEAATDEQAEYVDPATIHGRAGASESDEEDEDDGEEPAPLRSNSQLDSSASTG